MHTLDVNETVRDAQFLNCDNAHLAAVLQFYGARDPSAPMGEQWYFELRMDTLVPVTARVPVLEAIARHSGVVLTRTQIPAERYHETLAAFIRDGHPVIIYGDSIDMPWLPYFGNESSPHPTLVDGIADDWSQVRVVEAYTNTTPDGPVIPGPAFVSRVDFDTLVAALPPERRGEVIVFDGRQDPDPVPPADTLRANAHAISVHVGELDELRTFAERGRAAAADLSAMASFDLGCWEVTRARSCHERWLGRLSAADPGLVPATLVEQFATDIADPWRRVSQFAFIAAQRLRRGAAVPTVSFELISDHLADAELRFAGALLRRLDRSAER